MNWTDGKWIHVEFMVLGLEITLKMLNTCSLKN